LLPDLVLMDIVMPDIGGLEVIRRLRKLPVFKAVPIIAISASATPEVEADTLTAGADAFLPKPVDLEALMARTASLLNLAWVEGTEWSGRVVA
jgi:CheY-like chemotaxis protein